MSEPSMPRSLKPAKGQLVVQSGPATKLPSTVVSSKPLAVFAAPSTSKHSEPVAKLVSPQSQKLVAVKKPVKHSEKRPTSSQPPIYDATMYDAVKRPEDPRLALRPTPSAARLYATVEARSSAYPPPASRPSGAHDASPQASGGGRSTAGPN